MIALPGQLFYTTQIPVCLWFLTRSKKNGKFRDRRGETLFIDARKLGQLVDRTHRELTDEEIARIAKTYHAWRGEKGAGKYADVAGFCKSATTEEIRPRVRAHARPLRRGRGSRGRRRAVRRQDAAAHEHAGRSSSKSRPSWRRPSSRISRAWAFPRRSSMTENLPVPAPRTPASCFSISPRTGRTRLEVRLEGETVWLPQKADGRAVPDHAANVNPATLKPFTTRGNSPRRQLLGVT